MLQARGILAVADSPMFGRVLQCPVVLRAGPDVLDLLVSSRDSANRSRILSIRLAGVRGPRPRLVWVHPLLESTDIDPDCVGVMSGDLVQETAGPVLVGNAYYLTGGRLDSRLFTMPLDRGDGVAGPPVGGEVSWLWTEDDGIFRATPAVVTHGRVRTLVYLRPLEPSPPDGRFPTQYQLFRAPLDDELELTGEESPLLSGAVLGSWAKPAQDPENPRNLWLSHRGVIANRDGYQLGRATLEPGGTVSSLTLFGNGGLGETPPGLGMLCYPEPLPGGSLIACSGEFGSAGLVAIADSLAEE